jgi:hypothetical protein
MASQAQIDANRRNARLSRGPTSEAGLEKSSMNALKHGRRSTRLKRFQADSYRYEERRVKWMAINDADNDMEEFLIAQTAAEATALERAQQADAERTTKLIENADEVEIEEAHDLGKRLFHDPSAPSALYGTTRLIYFDRRTSWRGQAIDPDDPAKLVRKLASTASGVAWMLEQWVTLRGFLEEPDGLWAPPQRLEAIRLLGCQPVDVIHDRRVADIFAASHALYAAGKPFQELESDVWQSCMADFVRHVKAQWKGLVRKDEVEKAREILFELVDTNIAELEAKFQVFVENMEVDADRQVDRLSFDMSAEAVAMRASELKLANRFFRSVETYNKVPSCQFPVASRELPGAD